MSKHFEHHNTRIETGSPLTLAMRESVKKASLIHLREQGKSKPQYLPYAVRSDNFPNQWITGHAVFEPQGAIVYQKLKPKVTPLPLRKLSNGCAWHQKGEHPPKDAKFQATVTISLVKGKREVIAYGETEDAAKDALRKRLGEGFEDNVKATYADDAVLWPRNFPIELLRELEYQTIGDHVSAHASANLVHERFVNGVEVFFHKTKSGQVVIDILVIPNSTNQAHDVFVTEKTLLAEEITENKLMRPKGVDEKEQAQKNKLRQQLLRKTFFISFILRKKPQFIGFPNTNYSLDLQHNIENVKKQGFTQLSISTAVRETDQTLKRIQQLEDYLDELKSISEPNEQVREVWKKANSELEEIFPQKLREAIASQVEKEYAIKEKFKSFNVVTSTIPEINFALRRMLQKNPDTSPLSPARKQTACRLLKRNLTADEMMDGKAVAQVLKPRNRKKSPREHSSFHKHPYHHPDEKPMSEVALRKEREVIRANQSQEKEHNAKPDERVLPEAIILVKPDQSNEVKAEHLGRTLAYLVGGMEDRPLTEVTVFQDELMLVPLNEAHPDSIIKSESEIYTPTDDAIKMLLCHSMDSVESFRLRAKKLMDIVEKWDIQKFIELQEKHISTGSISVTQDLMDIYSGDRQTAQLFFFALSNAVLGKKRPIEKPQEDEIFKGIYQILVDPKNISQQRVTALSLPTTIHTIIAYVGKVRIQNSLRAIQEVHNDKANLLHRLFYDNDVKQLNRSLEADEDVYIRSQASNKVKAVLKGDEIINELYTEKERLGKIEDINSLSLDKDFIFSMLERKEFETYRRIKNLSEKENIPAVEESDLKLKALRNANDYLDFLSLRQCYLAELSPNVKKT